MDTGGLSKMTLFCILLSPGFEGYDIATWQRERPSSREVRAEAQPSREFCVMHQQLIRNLTDQIVIGRAWDLEELVVQLH